MATDAWCSAALVALSDPVAIVLRMRFPKPRLADAPRSPGGPSGRAFPNALGQAAPGPRAPVRVLACLVLAPVFLALARVFPAPAPAPAFLVQVYLVLSACGFLLSIRRPYAGSEAAHRASSDSTQVKADPTELVPAVTAADPSPGSVTRTSIPKPCRANAVSDPRACMSRARVAHLRRTLTAGRPPA
jgi:hypothetical protein